MAERRQRGRGQADLRRAEQEHGAAHDPEALWPQFQADQEQQHDDAELGDRRDLLDVGDQPQAEGPIAIPASR